MKDLFEHYETLPLKIKEIISVFNTEIDVTENDYDLCKKLVSELEIHGYTCEYNLDAIPYNLQKIEATNETPEEMKTENIVFEHENKQVIQKGNHFFTRITENGESFESGDFNTLEKAKESLGIEPTTEEKNKLIAKFIGLNFEQEQERIFINGLGTKLINETFNSDWNWLISVIEKCRESQIFGSQRLIDNIDKRLLKLDLLATYSNVIDFITWHNEQTKTN